MAPMVDKPMDSGEARLAALGYKQELKRDFNLFTNTAISFSIISCTSGVVANYTLAWVNGGPATVVWAWIMVCSLTMFIGVAMAEIVSSLPSSGGPYFWSAELSNKAWSPFAAWMTGWFNLLGQVAITAGIDFALANHLSAMIALSNGHICSQKQLLLIYGVTLVIHALINCLPTRVLGWLNGVSVVWHVAGALCLTILIPVVAPTHQTAAWVFGNFEAADVDSQGAPSAAYIFLVGTLMAQFTITGYDACGHMSEETTSADRNAAWGVIIAVGMSFVVGLLLILGMTFSIQDPDTLLTGAANGYVGGQIFYDAFMARYGSGQGGVAAMGIPLGTLFLCGASSVTSNSRMCWSFARDGALPGHQLWSKVNAITGTPINAMLLMVTLAFILGLPMLNSTVAFGAVISISTIGLYISYGIPIVVRLLNNKQFQPGPVYFGRVGIFVGWIGAAWCVAITAIFIMPTIYPVTVTTLNYAPVAVGIVLIWALASFFCPGIGARHWYRGEKHTIEDFTVHKRQAEEAAKGNYASNGNEDSAHSIGYNSAPVKTV